MGVAERVSRRTVTSSAQAAVDAAQDCIATLNRQAAEIKRLQNEVADNRNSYRSAIVRLDAAAAAINTRIDAQGHMVQAAEGRLDALDGASSDSGTSAERPLIARVEKQRRMIGALEDDLRGGRVAFSDVGFVGRLRWLFTGRAK